MQYLLTAVTLHVMRLVIRENRHGLLARMLKRRMVKLSLEKYRLILKQREVKTSLKAYIERQQKIKQALPWDFI